MTKMHLRGSAEELQYGRPPDIDPASLTSTRLLVASTYTRLVGCTLLLWQFCNTFDGCHWFFSHFKLLMDHGISAPAISPFKYKDVEDRAMCNLFLL